MNVTDKEMNTVGRRLLTGHGPTPRNYTALRPVPVDHVQQEPMVPVNHVQVNQVEIAQVQVEHVYVDVKRVMIEKRAKNPRVEYEMMQPNDEPMI